MELKRFVDEPKTVCTGERYMNLDVKFHVPILTAVSSKRTYKVQALQHR
jgi:hypothetical protein